MEVASVQAAQQFTSEDVRERLENASPQARCIVHYETGGRYDPYALGAQGERGPAQLHPRGKLLRFYADGYTNPNDPDQAVTFLEAQLKEGQGSAWTPVSRGLC